GENLFVLFMASSSQELKPPRNPGRFTTHVDDESPKLFSLTASFRARLLSRAMNSGKTVATQPPDI
ncbi:hypothetical protein, partial [Halopseudomonas sp.]|uniref:hypothetical protein n=1 Tax=Halopseudomonas sp. TaxID=2901191 RepID=UPI003002FC79